MERKDNLVHVRIGRVFQIRGVQEVEGELFVPFLVLVDPHARLVVQRTIVRQHQVGAVQMEDGRHGGGVLRGERRRVAGGCPGAAQQVREWYPSSDRRRTPPPQQ